MLKITGIARDLRKCKANASIRKEQRLKKLSFHFKKLEKEV